VHASAAPYGRAQEEVVQVDAERLSADDLARLAEVELVFVRRAVRAGALGDRVEVTGLGVQDAARLRFLNAWDAAGLPVEAIASLIRRGELSFSFLAGPTTAAHPRSAATYQELCAAHGIELSRVQRLHDALGFTPPAATDHVREDDRILLELLRELAAAGADEPAALRLVRVYADALRRLAQAEAELYESQVEAKLRQAGATEQDLLDRGGQTGARLPALFEQALTAIYRRHRQHVWLDHSISHVEHILETNGLHQRLDRPPCVCFVDLSGYTRLTAEHGDELAADLAGRLALLVEGICRRHGGRAVRWLGDGGMLVFRVPDASVRAAVEMVTRAPANGLPPTHIGIHCGPVVFQDGDIYGSTVNIAARLSARAAPGEVLVSSSVADRVGDAGPLEHVGAVKLKGLDRPMEVYRALAATGGHPTGGATG
jgi:adenylate cyclase